MLKISPTIQKYMAESQQRTAKLDYARPDRDRLSALLGQDLPANHQDRLDHIEKMRSAWNTYKEKINA